jgi:peptide deformylase
MKKVPAKIEIIQKDNPLLRKVSTSIALSKIKTAEIKKVIADMKKAVLSQADAVAISAVQISKPIRLFIISKRAFDINSDSKKSENTDMVFINPKISRSSKSKQELEEGCLSVRYAYGQVERPEKVTVEALDENGKKFSRGFSGFLAQIVQHENDHLDGILFIDKAKNIKEISHDEYEKSLREMSER